MRNMASSGQIVFSLDASRLSFLDNAFAVMGSQGDQQKTSIIPVSRGDQMINVGGSTELQVLLLDGDTKIILDTISLVDGSSLSADRQPSSCCQTAMPQPCCPSATSMTMTCGMSGVCHIGYSVNLLTSFQSHGGTASTMSNCCNAGNNNNIVAATSCPMLQPVTPMGLNCNSQTVTMVSPGTAMISYDGTHSGPVSSSPIPFASQPATFAQGQVMSAPPANIDIPSLLSQRMLTSYKAYANRVSRNNGMVGSRRRKR